MNDYELEGIQNILTDILDDPRRDNGPESWLEYDCPRCAEYAGVDFDGKHNLNINIVKGYFHCWKCGYSGKIGNLVRDYGTTDQWYEYRGLFNSLLNAGLYNLSRDENEDIKTEDEEVFLPKDFTRLSREDPNAIEAYKYLEGRGIGDKIIERYSIGYVNRHGRDWKVRNRIVFPSYGRYGELNYWVARDYTGKKKIKYTNAMTEKTKIIFNEHLINWYETLTLVEGPFDHIVVPNSIPLLGKVIKSENALYEAIMHKLKAPLRIFLDDDAYESAKKIYKLFNIGKLRNNVTIVDCPDGYDASQLYQEGGNKAIIDVLKNAHQVHEFDLLGV